MLDELHDLVGITPLVVVPGNYLNESIGKVNAGVGVEDGGTGIAEEVGGNDSVLSVAEDTLELALRGGLHGGADVSLGGRLLEVDGEVNYGDVEGGNAHGDAGELAVELGDDLADSLGSAGGGGDDVAGSSTTAAPILSGDAVNGLLGGGGGVNGGHKAFLDAEVVVKDLGNRSEAVGGAGSVGYEIHILGVLVLVDADDEHRGVILRGGGHDDLLRARSEVALSLLLGEEEAGGLYDILRADLAPRQVLLLALAENSDLTAVYDDGMIGVVNGAVELALHGVILEHVSHVIGGDKVIDADDFDVLVIKAGAENKPSDAAEAVDANFDVCHFLALHYNNINVFAAAHIKRPSDYGL